MKNLKLYSELTLSIALKEETSLSSAIDIERNRLFFSSSDGVLYTIQPSSSQQKERRNIEISTTVRDVLLDLDPNDCIKSLDYLMEKEALILGTSSGYLLLHVVDANAAEVVGRVEGGVNSITSSPDGALLAVTSGFGQILVMTQDWEVLYETLLDSHDDDNSTESSDPLLSPRKLLKSQISWRGDGKYFATLCWWPNSLSQKLKVWERESGNLHALSDSKTFMGTCLDWMPSGAKIVTACDRKCENKCPLIVFFERNGLERSSFSIDERVDAMVDILKWNCTGDLLAVLVRFPECDAIRIWYFSNNQWYLKQEIRYPKKDAVKFLWNPTEPLQIVCWTLGGKIVTYSFVWISAVTENSIALVIDGNRILVSPLALSLMPPPMCLFTLKCPFAIQSLAFLLKNTNPCLALGLSDGSLSVLNLPIIDTWLELEGKEFRIEPLEAMTPVGPVRHLVWLDLHTLLCVSQGETKQGGCCLLEIQLVCSENFDPAVVTSSGWNATLSNSTCLESSVVGIVTNPVRRGVAFVQFDGGSVFEYSSTSGVTSLAAEPHFQKLDHGVGFLSSCPWMNAIPVLENGALKPFVFGLDGSGRLQVRGKIMCHNCTSCLFYANTMAVIQQAVTHIILTTKQDCLLITDTDNVLQGNIEEKIENIKSGSMKRKKEENGDSITVWERGAKLVGVIHGDEAAIILQTCRGNLECIYPRKLVLQSIVCALTQRRFKDAILMVRRHRIDFNVIVDHCGWQSFLPCASEFVHQVNNLNYITDFICSIKNENVMETLYKNFNFAFIENPSNGGPVGLACTKNKVSSVLEALKMALEDKVPASPARELCILTSLARTEPPALEEALKRIKVIREKELLGLDDNWRQLYPTAEDSVKHLLWLSDPEAVYEAALGLYDLNLAGIVALNSQKDPKEFLPFLQGLENLPTSVMKYTIDLKLHRYESALKHLFSAGEAYYDDCMHLINGNPQLFPLGVHLFSNGPRRNKVLESWADHLYEQKCFEDAAVNYLCCSSLQKALKAFRASGDWRNVLSLAGLLSVEKKEVVQLANELCEELNALGRSSDAARVALEYCGDVVGAVGYFMSAREWKEALRVAVMHGKEDLVCEVKTTAMESVSSLICEYEEGKEKIGKYLARYLAVRQRRLLLKGKLELEERSVNDNDDDASETSSTFSGMSAYSRGTTKGSRASVSSNAGSKSRRQRCLGKKEGKIRAGSPGEEMALVAHLKGMALTIIERHELRSLLLILVMLGEEDNARRLQHAGDSFQRSQLAAVKLAEDTVSSDVIDEGTHTLKHYLQKVQGELKDSGAFFWQLEVLLPS